MSLKSSLVLFGNLALIIGCLAQEAETDKDVPAEEEPLLGFLDYILLAAIAAVCFWWFYWRDRDSDKIPEVDHIDIQDS